jgi:hypothetical protein
MAITDVVIAAVVIADMVITDVVTSGMWSSLDFVFGIGIIADTVITDARPAWTWGCGMRSHGHRESAITGLPYSLNNYIYSLTMSHGRESAISVLGHGESLASAARVSRWLC